MTSKSNDAHVDQALRKLSQTHHVMRHLIETHGPYTPRPEANPEVFGPLARSIIYQQLAGKAAAAIYGRFEALFDGQPTANAALSLDPETIRSAGLSRSKRDAILSLAEFSLTAEGQIERLLTLGDKAQERALCVVRGIGPWTAQMWQLFHLGRLDIWPTLDLGVRKGFSKAFGTPAMPSSKELGPLGEPFKPYRSIVAWYCWRAADAP